MFIYSIVDYSGKRTKSFDVLTNDQELEVRTATYGPGIGKPQCAKSVNHIIKAAMLKSVLRTSAEAEILKILQNNQP